MRWLVLKNWYKWFDESFAKLIKTKKYVWLWMFCHISTEKKIIFCSVFNVNFTIFLLSLTTLTKNDTNDLTIFVAISIYRRQSLGSDNVDFTKSWMQSKYNKLGRLKQQKFPIMQMTSSWSKSSYPYLFWQINGYYEEYLIFCI